MRLPLTVAAACVLASPAFAQLATPNDAGLRFGHVHLNVSDIEVHKRLWVEHFGGEIVQRSSHTVVRLPGLFVALSARQPSGGSQGSGMDHFGFHVRNIAKFLAKWRAAGLPVMSEFTGAQGHPNAYVMLPDDIRVELQEEQWLPVEIAGNHIHFRAAEQEALLAWYLDIFGLEQRSRGSIQTTTNVPGMNLSFGGSSTPLAATRGRSIDHIGFELDDLEAFCKMLADRGIEFEVDFETVAPFGLKIAFLIDPAGVRIELTEGYDEY